MNESHESYLVITFRYTGLIWCIGFDKEQKSSFKPLRGRVATQLSESGLSGLYQH